MPGHNTVRLSRQPPPFFLVPVDCLVLFTGSPGCMGLLGDSWIFSPRLADKRYIFNTSPDRIGDFVVTPLARHYKKVDVDCYNLERVLKTNCFFTNSFSVSQYCGDGKYKQIRPYLLKYAVQGFCVKFFKI